MIFLDLHKAYDALDRDRCLEILEGYRMGPRARLIQAGGYYGTAFQGFRGGAHGDPLSPTIFNVVVDALV